MEPDNDLLEYSKNSVCLNIELLDDNPITPSAKKSYRSKLMCASVESYVLPLDTPQTENQEATKNLTRVNKFEF